MIIPLTLVSECNRQQRPSLPTNKIHINDKDSGRNSSPTRRLEMRDKDAGRNSSPSRRLNIRDKALINAVEIAAKQKVAGKDISVSEPALKVVPVNDQPPIRKYKSENQTKDPKLVGKAHPENTAKFDESLNETFAKLDAAFGFRRHNGNSHRHNVETPPRDEKRKKKKNNRRRSRNFEPPSSDSSEDIELDSKRRSRNLRKVNLDEALCNKTPKSEAEESLEAAISDFRISLSDMQDDHKRDSVIGSTTASRSVDRNSLSMNNLNTQSTTSQDGVRDHGMPGTSTANHQQKQQPQKLAYVKTIPVNTVQASSIQRPVGDGTAILNMTPNTSDNDPKNKGRSRSEAKITMRSRQCGSPTPRTEDIEILDDNVDNKQLNTGIEPNENITVVESVFLQEEIIPPLPPLPFIPLSPTRGGIQTLPERSDKKRRGTCGDTMSKGNSGEI